MSNLSLMKRERRQIEKVEKQMALVAELVKQGMSRHSDVYLAAVQTIAAAMAEADAKKWKNGTMTAEQSAIFSRLDQDYLAAIEGDITVAYHEIWHVMQETIGRSGNGFDRKLPPFFLLNEINE